MRLQQNGTTIIEDSNAVAVSYASFSGVFHVDIEHFSLLHSLKGGQVAESRVQEIIGLAC